MVVRTSEYQWTGSDGRLKDGLILFVPILIRYQHVQTQVADEQGKTIDIRFIYARLSFWRGGLSVIMRSV